MTGNSTESVEACLTAVPGYTDHDRQRWIPEQGKNSYRNEFERDRARVLHSSAWRRLGAKTQVLAPGSDDFIRTRLTHSMEVAQVGRDLGRALGCNPDVVDTACLSHDLGHPPFGHNGEKALDEIAEDIGGFEGNAQTLRLLTRLEPKVVYSGPDSSQDGFISAGLNLTRASLDASCKYPWTRVNFPMGYTRKRSFKFGVYPEDEPAFDWLRTQEDGSRAVGFRRCVEAQVMDLADDISYSVHDVEDAVQGASVRLDELGGSGVRSRVVEYTRSWYVPDSSASDIEAALRRLEETSCWIRRMDGSRTAMAALKNMASQLIGRFVLSVIESTRRVYGKQQLTRYNADVVVPEETQLEIAVLKGIATAFVMVTDERRSCYERQREMLHDLVASLSYTGDEYLDAIFAQDWRQACDDYARLRVVVDQVASLTDSSAMELHQRLRSKGPLQKSLR